MLMQTMPPPTAAESDTAGFEAGEDAVLARRAAAADMLAFEALYHRHHRLCRFHYHRMAAVLLQLLLPTWQFLLHNGPLLHQSLHYY